MRGSYGQRAPGRHGRRRTAAIRGIVLWQADGIHPTLAGTYLAACVLYARIFNASPAGIADTAGLPPDVAGMLQAIADQR